ncbi:hypothetical protein [Streptomyces violaceus]|uniref:Helix-turn-helix domain-containing protein n=1 Tax=Streptomyces violaceus TaxID=1936 RepID=A0ABY9UPF2_STRVL|nr:hypothetical protein [Streptomyces janthinus]WND24162.1 hypothetical protein RI060_43355 [Streptomyces janthinus]GGS96774.1 hypothetical protein GCM10010270_80910 [Streptomyces janthinus]
MAATHYSPLPDEIEDPVSYKEASALLARTGHKVDPETIRRWVREGKLETVRKRRTDYASWTDILDVHFERTAAKLRASSNWP